MKESPGVVRVALGAIAGCTAATALYGVMRVVQALIFSEVNPAVILYSAHAGYVWRVWTVGYVGGMIGVMTWLVAAKNPARVADILVRAIPIAAAIVAAQGLLVP